MHSPQTIVDMINKMTPDEAEHLSKLTRPRQERLVRIIMAAIERKNSETLH